MGGREEKTAHAVLVWDWPLRAFHWLLAASATGSWATHYAGLDWFQWHRWFGYTTLLLVLFRVAWGFVGPRHARFANFVRGPRTVISYLRCAKSPAFPGHSPLGALSVLVLLASLILQAATGLFANDEIANAGPFFGWISQPSSNRVTHLHELNSKVLLGLIVLHVVAVAWYDLGRRAGLTRAMLTGRKMLLPPNEGIANSRAFSAGVIIAVLGAALALAIRAAPEATFSFF